MLPSEVRLRSDVHVCLVFFCFALFGAGVVPQCGVGVVWNASYTCDAQSVPGMFVAPALVQHMRFSFLFKRSIVYAPLVVVVCIIPTRLMLAVQIGV